MEIKASQFLGSFTDISKIPFGSLPEFVLIGKSNVGKSSFLNALASRKALARISAKPGKTQTANSYVLNDEFYVVDMPGYGYAKASKSAKESFAKIIFDYFKKRQNDFIVFFLLDYRHEPTNGDKEMLGKIVSNEIVPIIILTKADKLTKNERNKNLNIIKRELKLENDSLVIVTSSQTKEGIGEVLDFMQGIKEDY